MHVIGQCPAEAQSVIAALDVLNLDLAVVQKDLSSGVTGSQLGQDLHALHNALIDLVSAKVIFAADTRVDTGSHVSVHALFTHGPDQQFDLLESRDAGWSENNSQVCS